MIRVYELTLIRIRLVLIVVLSYAGAIRVIMLLSQTKYFLGCPASCANSLNTPNCIDPCS
jgi:hypothetical protein